LQGPGAGGFALVIEADQQIRAQTRELPEDKQSDDIIRKNQPQHGTHKKKHQRIEPSKLGVAVKIGTRVDQHQSADETDQ